MNGLVTTFNSTSLIARFYPKLINITRVYRGPLRRLSRRRLRKRKLWSLRVITTTMQRRRRVVRLSLKGMLSLRRILENKSATYGMLHTRSTVRGRSKCFYSCMMSTKRTTGLRAPTTANPRIRNLAASRTLNYIVGLRSPCTKP